MKIKKILWTEGMFLRPQHFQQQESLLSNQQFLMLQTLGHYYWGFSELEIDTHLLKQNKFNIIKATGVFPDGTVFELKDTDLASYPLENLKNNQMLYLAIPSKKASLQEVDYEEKDNSLARYRVVEQEVVDVTNVALNEVTIQFAKPVYRLLTQQEIDSNWEILPIADFQGRANDNSVLMNFSYIQPTLNCHLVKNTLKNHLQDVISLLSYRSEKLSERITPKNRTSSSTYVETIILGIINRNLILFKHLNTLKYLHPEIFFRHLVMLVAEMAMFHPESISLDDIPVYVHDDLKPSLESLMSQLNNALNIVFEDAYIVIPLDDKGHGLRTGNVKDKGLFKTSDFILAVKADMPDDILRKTFPTQVKLGSTEKMKELVHLQLPGIHLRQIDQVPSALPYHAGYTYFSLEKKGDMWQQFERSAALALHLAGDFPGLDMRFWAVKTNR
ncbi:protein ImpJ/VasE [Pelistega indica]|uniref:Protein ImpJ/VasE n=1 Tax=Pelistega indica TaxID=1414851 RepID=V8FRU4_9BURK|nr:type VI secretion system baseplate subunit TssK [Pelistega indica]ETD66890.1 protein ImpJ/VasE [Pelistega indica]